jgi:hypothetical protein
MKLLTKKLGQLINTLPNGFKKKEVINDYLKLKVTKDNKLYLSLEKKYKNEI